MRIQGDELTIYAIGVDAPPRRSDWVVNKRAEKGNPEEPVIEPRTPMQPHLVEEPILIVAPKVTPVASVGGA